ncbi:MAG: hypothetical protein H6636_14240 [Anaerolineales bacterium]|nr:hypothetical protein [Anaerolineales bacterium]
MARKYEAGKLDRLYEAVEDYEGERPGFFARLLGWQRSDVTRALPALEDEGLLVSEDDRGGLWLFRRNK